MDSRSLLTQAMLEPLLKLMRRNLERDGFLFPYMMIRDSETPPLVVPLELHKSAEQRRLYVSRIGEHLRLLGQQITEALLLSEVWFVDAGTTLAAWNYAPSEHPSRQEAIVMIGRNLNKTKITCVLQPFKRDQEHKPIWTPISDIVYTRPAENALQWIGLLDDLFLANH